MRDGGKQRWKGNRNGEQDGNVGDRQQDKEEHRRSKRRTLKREWTRERRATGSRGGRIDRKFPIFAFLISACEEVLMSKSEWSK